VPRASGVSDTGLARDDRRASASGAILPSTERRSAALAPARDPANEPLPPATRHARQPAWAWHRQLGAALGEGWPKILFDLPGPPDSARSILGLARVEMG
jgi:hypothetical protein